MADPPHPRRPLTLGALAPLNDLRIIDILLFLGPPDLLTCQAVSHGALLARM